MTPVDNIEVKANRLLFSDLAVDSGLAEMNRRKYFYSMYLNDGKSKKIIINEHRESKDHTIDISQVSEEMENPFMTVRIEIEDAGMGVGRGVDVYLYCRDHMPCRVTGLDRR